ncbi:conserved hypothetical protein [Parvibaculum lavamentivorans DS-1]|uniref:DUF2254 domain-containing protein n=1 Tax=Parvibaculum lavamentivorans (strain DS-1 / DSM 13023 / NCIMB 13966) TaxID=402881 RepID=A7HYA6_PARL1|nr:DUF2254 domain-containing protein [Parvibaculum lavamentivorans]ABS64889.1 conserved hypothetical protein [Parvibaculum lavamentivorans DS-1]
MIEKWRWILLGLTRKLWLRASLFALLGVATALLSTGAEWLIPWDLPGKIGSDAVDQILNILASSMLAVTTFSLTIMVTAYSAATSDVTPRATKLLRQDTTTQNVLATFIGSFLYSLVGIIALNTELYGERGRVMLFVVTLGVIVIIVVTLLRWIQHLASLGRVDETSSRIEEAAFATMDKRARDPFMGGRPLRNGQESVPGAAVPIYAPDTGYIQHIDMQALSAAAGKFDVDIYLGALPGAFVDPARPLVWIVRPEEKGEGEEKGWDEEKFSALVCAACAIGGLRTFDADPRFGLVVLAEIASRALSPGVNDPGTAIDIIGRLLRLLLRWMKADGDAGSEKPVCPRIWVPPLKLEDLFDDAFAPIARDGASIVEVQVKLQKTLLTLAQLGDAAWKECALHHARMALQRAEDGLLLEEEKIRLRKIVRSMTE